MDVKRHKLDCSPPQDSLLVILYLFLILEVYSGIRNAFIFPPIFLDKISYFQFYLGQ